MAAPAQAHFAELSEWRPDHPRCLRAHAQLGPFVNFFNYLSLAPAAYPVNPVGELLVASRYARHGAPEIRGQNRGTPYLFKIGGHHTYFKSGDIYEAVPVKRVGRGFGAEDASARARRRRPRSICPISAGACRERSVSSSAPALSLRRRESSAVGSSRAGPTRRDAQPSIRDHPVSRRPMKKESDGRHHSA